MTQVESSEFLSDLQEGKDESDGEVGQPVEATGHCVGGWSVRLFKQLRGDQEWYAGYMKERKNRMDQSGVSSSIVTEVTRKAISHDSNHISLLSTAVFSFRVS